MKSCASRSWRNSDKGVSLRRALSCSGRSEKLGFSVDGDNRMGENFRNVQLTPTGSACSVTIGTGLTPGLQMCVSDAEAARAELVGRGVEVSEIQHIEDGVWADRPRDPGIRSSSRIRTATTGPWRRSPWPDRAIYGLVGHQRRRASAGAEGNVVT
jgi:hypothetical protein